MSDPIVLVHALENPNVRAFLRGLRLGETNPDDDQAYQWLFGSTRKSPRLFDDFSDHPRVRTYEKYDGQFIKNGKLDFTTAAGAYQIVASTWDPAARKWGFKDFSPKNQDLCAVALILGRRALDDVVAGRIDEAVAKCRNEWASLPGASHGDQPTVAMSAFRSVYEQYGGSYGPVDGGEPPNPFVEEKPMAPFIAAAIPAIISAVPELVKMFGSGSEISERNAKAAEVVVGIAKEAIGAVNEQQLVETIEKDPQAVEAVRAAVKDNWYQLTEVGGGIAAAREFGLKAQGDRTFVHNPAVWISAILLLMPFMLLVDVFYVHPDNYDANLRTQIVTGVLMVISGVMGYWLGSSRGSSVKDEALLRK